MATENVGDQLWFRIGFADSQTLGLGLALSDSNTLSDFQSGGFGGTAADQVVLGELVSGGFGDKMPGDQEVLSDSATYFLSGGPVTAVPYRHLHMGMNRGLNG